MKLDINEKNYILPMLEVGQSKTYKIVAHKDTTDCLILEEKQRKDNKGSFSQYELALENENGETRYCRFLLSSQIKPLVSQWGQNSDDWVNQFVVVSGMPEEKGMDTYYKLHFLPSNNPKWSEEKVA